MQFCPMIGDIGYTHHSVKAVSDDHARRKIKCNLIQEGFLALFDAWKEAGMAVASYERKTPDRSSTGRAN